jgi:hypothetical protein
VSLAARLQGDERQSAFRPPAGRAREAICIQMENLGPDAREVNFEQLWQQLLDLKVAIDLI